MKYYMKLVREGNKKFCGWQNICSLLVWNYSLARYRKVFLSL